MAMKIPDDKHATFVRIETEKQAREVVRSIIQELAADSDWKPGDGGRLVEDLGYHSLALIGLRLALERQLQLQHISEETAQTMRTAVDVEDFVIDRFRTSGRLADSSR